MRPSRLATLGSLTLLYLAQGIPFGLAAEYLPVVLRKAHYSLSAIAALSYLQLPWQLKILWSRAGDHPPLRRRSRGILLALQLMLAAIVACYSLFSLQEAPVFWFTLTTLAALFAATQDVFTDAFAVRALSAKDRGYGNIAQVAGYRVGMLAGGAGLLILGHSFGPRATLLSCAALIAVTSIGAFAVRESENANSRSTGRRETLENADAGAPSGFFSLLAHVFSPRARKAILLALTFKLGMHVQASLIKPSLVDAHWDEADIGWIAVTVGTAMGLLGALAGGLAHRAMREKHALIASGILHALVCVPVIIALDHGAPRALTGIAVASEHFASGLGTTVLFAALMSATRKRDAGFHYTVLTSANAIAIGLGGLMGGVVADHTSKTFAFALGGALSLASLVFVRRWDETARASAAPTTDSAIA